MGRKFTRHYLKILRGIAAEYQKRGINLSHSAIARDPRLAGATGTAGEQPTRQSIAKYCTSRDPKTAIAAIDKLIAPKAKKVQPKYVEKYSESQGEKMRQEYVAMLSRTKGRKYPKTKARPTIMQAWRILGTDPAHWDEAEFRKLWEHPDFKNPETGMIHIRHSANLKFLMRAIGKGHLATKDFFTMVTRIRGKAKEHYLTKANVFKLIPLIPHADALVLFALALETGGRFSSLELVEAKHLKSPSFSRGLLEMEEPKLRGKGLHKVTRMLSPMLVKLLTDYTEHYNIKAGLLFRWGQDKYNRLFKRLAKKHLGISEATTGWNLTSHKFKHTMVTLAGAHGVGLGTISRQAHTDPSTLEQFYQFVEEATIRRDLYGIVEEGAKLTWLDFLKEMHELIRETFDRIKHKGVLVNGIVTPEELATRKKKGINVMTLYSQLHSPKVRMHLRESALSRLKALPTEELEKLKRAVEAKGQSFSLELHKH